MHIWLADFFFLHASAEQGSSTPAAPACMKKKSHICISRAGQQHTCSPCSPFDTGRRSLSLLRFATTFNLCLNKRRPT